MAGGDQVGSTLGQVEETRTFGVLINPNRPGLEIQLQELRAAAGKLHLKLSVAH